ADDKKPILAAALETAFDPATSAGSIGLGQAARAAAAAWLPPGIAYAAVADEAKTSGSAPIDAGENELPEIDLEPADLPAFLTEEEPAALDGAEFAAE
ncbi:MAG TPA: hypothetical protein VFQ82_11130, partial [Stellaceae bacterium]|nr:hypothetical protein [Stellaceae bacterium]